VRGEDQLLGYCAALTCRDNKQTRPDLPVIIISGYGMKRCAAMAEGASVISKHRT
jgi:hypothetical protein